MGNTYWNGTGKEDKKLTEMEASGWAYSKKTMTVFNSYYRYYNDGDFPGWARGDWSIRKTGRFGWELNERGIEMQENRVTEQILAEYKRFAKKMKANK